MKKPISLLFTLFFIGFTNAQNVGIGTNNPANSAKLEVNSTTQGFLPPRMTEVQRNAIVSPVVGLVIFNSSTNLLNVYVGPGWNEIRGNVSYPAGTINCTSLPTAIVDVLNPATGKTWMDRNLGATRAAISSTDAEAYGDLYQWGRRADGHQCRNSATISTLSSTNLPVHGNFIINSSNPFDWRSPQNTALWQGVNGVNNPCPGGYRIPTDAELNEERVSWGINNNVGAFTSPLKLPTAGSRYYSDGSFMYVDTYGLYWSSTVSNANSRNLLFGPTLTSMTADYRLHGNSVRCIKD